MKNKTLKKIIAIAVLVILVGAALMLIGNKMKADAIKEKWEEERYSDWLAEDCKCLEKGRIYCAEGFEIKDIWCYNEETKKFASRLIGCSKYECLEGIKVWNNSTQKWEGITK